MEELMEYKVGDVLSPICPLHTNGFKDPEEADCPDTCPLKQWEYLVLRAEDGEHFAVEKSGGGNAGDQLLDIEGFQMNVDADERPEQKWLDMDNSWFDDQLHFDIQFKRVGHFRPTLEGMKRMYQNPDSPKLSGELVGFNGEVYFRTLDSNGWDHVFLNEDARVVSLPYPVHRFDRYGIDIGWFWWEEKQEWDREFEGWWE